MSSNPINWFEIYVQDTERARTFYEHVFKIKLEKLENTELEILAFPSRLDTFGCSGALVKMPGMPSGGNSTIVYFHCEDCAVEAGRVVKAGGKIHKEKFSIGQYGHIALGHDTEGNIFGMHSMK